MELAMGVGLDRAALGAALSGLSGRLADLSFAMEQAGRYMQGSVLANFRAQGRPEGWQPLSAGTVRRKGHAVILYETGRLMSSVTYSAGPDSFSLGAPVPYARAQQEGGGHMPARPFLLFQEADVEAVMRIVGSYLTGEGGEVS